MFLLWLQGKTSSKKAYNPEWREELTFIDIFPPLCNRIKVQLCDKDVTSDETISTHFIELAQIMDPTSDSDGKLYGFGFTGTEHNLRNEFSNFFKCCFILLKLKWRVVHGPMCPTEGKWCWLW